MEWRIIETESRMDNGTIEHALMVDREVVKTGTYTECVNVVENKMNKRDTLIECYLRHRPIKMSYDDVMGRRMEAVNW